MTYALVDEKGNRAGDAAIGEHLLSPRDLNTLELLPEICRSGVKSLKFEGRMKRPEYVATVIRIYRKALDRLQRDPEGFSVHSEEQKELAQIFNRDFTTGYLLANPGRDLMSYKRPNNRGVRIGRIEEIQSRGRMAAIKLDEWLRVGDGVEIWVTKGGRQGFFIEKIIHRGNPVLEAAPGQTVSINILGQPRVGDRVFKTHDVKLMERAQGSYLEPQKYVKVNFHFTARDGQPFLLEGEDERGNKAVFRSDYIVEKAEKRPASADDVHRQLNRLGGTSFQLNSLSFDMEEGLMLPASELNAARRFVIEEITKKRLKEYDHPYLDWKEVEKKFRDLIPEHKNRPGQKIKLAVRAGSINGAKAALDAGADAVYLDGEVFRSQKTLHLEKIGEFAQQAKEIGRETVFALPGIFHPRESKAVYQMIEKLQDTPVSALLTGNIGGITAVKKSCWDRKIYTDAGLNVFNDLTISFLTQKGINLITLSLELTFAQLEKMNFGSAGIECIVHGALPMMVSEYCVIGSVLGGRCKDKTCSRPCRERSFSLKDRMNFLFPVEVDQFCRMHIYNPKDLCLIAHVDKFIRLGVNSLRIEGKRYRPEVLFQITNSYRQAINAALQGRLDIINLEEMEKHLEKLSPAGITKGHYFRGVI